MIEKIHQHMTPNRCLKTLLTLIVMIGLQSCKKSTITASKPIVNKMVLVYVAANNNLKLDALKSINRMEQGAKLINGNLLVFVKTTSSSSHLLKIKYDHSDKIISDTIKSYVNRNSSDPSLLKEVIEDSRQLSPANSYGLVMWSHATSWTPPSNIKTKSFGSDNNQEMDIIDFKNAIPSDFEYIMFDACSMGSIEVVYELKEKARYILLSPAEVLSTSFPYETITPLFFGNSEDLKTICRKFIEYYEALSGLYASATVSLVDTKELELLAADTKILLETVKTKPDFNITKIQRMDFETNARVPAYDFLSFLEQNFTSNQLSSIKAKLNKAVVYSEYTSFFFSVPINTFSGLSVYLPTKNDSLYPYYSTLSWHKSSGWNNLFLSQN